MLVAAKIEEIKKERKERVTKVRSPPEAEHWSSLNIIAPCVLADLKKKEQNLHRGTKFT